MPDHRSAGSGTNSLGLCGSDSPVDIGRVSHLTPHFADGARAWRPHADDGVAFVVDALRRTRYNDPMQPGPPTVSLTDHSLHLWAGAVERATTTVSDDSTALLSADERVRAQRFRRAEDRHRFVHAHVAVRRTLSRYAPIRPEDWTFAAGQNGRPEITNADAPAGLRFNLSHTQGMVAIVVNRAFDAGVDVEVVGRVAGLEAMSRTSFTRAERAALLALPDAEQPLRFARTWALKESFVKAMSTGLTTPLRDVGFDLSEPGSIGFDCAPAIDPEPAAWSFTVGEPTDRHVLATAARLGAATTPTVEHYSLDDLLLGIEEPATDEPVADEGLSRLPKRCGAPAVG